MLEYYQKRQFINITSMIVTKTDFVFQFLTALLLNYVELINCFFFHYEHVQLIPGRYL